MVYNIHLLCCPDFSLCGHHILPWIYTRKVNVLPVLNGRTFIPKENKKEYVEELKSEIFASQAQTIIISSEEFDILDKSEFSEFRRDFSEFDIVPVVYVRNLPDLVSSMYQTSVVHSGYTKPVGSFVENQRSRLDIYGFVSDLKEVFATCVVFNFDSPSVKCDVVSSLTWLSDMPEELDLLSGERMNESHPAYCVELVRLLNSEPKNSDMVEKLLSFFSKESKSDKKYSLISEDMVSDLLYKYNNNIGCIISDIGIIKYGFDGFEFKPEIFYNDRVYVGDISSAFNEFVSRLF